MARRRKVIIRPPQRDAGRGRCVPSAAEGGAVDAEVRHTQGLTAPASSPAWICCGFAPSMARGRPRICHGAWRRQGQRSPASGSAHARTAPAHRRSNRGIRQSFVMLDLVCLLAQAPLPRLARGAPSTVAQPSTVPTRCRARLAVSVLASHIGEKTLRMSGVSVRPMGRSSMLPGRDHDVHERVISAPPRIPAWAGGA